MNWARHRRQQQQYQQLEAQRRRIAAGGGSIVRDLLFPLLVLAIAVVVIVNYREQLSSLGARTGRGQSPLIVVANTDNEGLFLRHTPSYADRDVLLREGVPLVRTGEEAVGDGWTWYRVRTPDGSTGWVPAQYTATSP